MKRKFVSVLLALVLVLSFSLVTAVPASAAALTSVTATPTDTTAGATTTYTIAFTTATLLEVAAAADQILITFPAGFDVSGATVNATTATQSGTDPTITDITGQLITLDVGADEAAGAQSIVLDVIINNETAADTYVVSIETQDGVGVTIDGPTDSATFTLFALPAITAVEPAEGNVGDTMWVEVTGTAFTGTAEACTTTFDFGTGISVVADSYNWISDTSVDCQIQITVAGAATVAATTTVGTGTTTGTFTANDADTAQVDVWVKYTPTDTTFDADTLDFDATTATITLGIAEAAAESASDPQVLIVHAATYTENPVVNYDYVTIKSLSGATGTIIDGSGGDYGVTLEGAGLTIEDLTINRGGTLGGQAGVRLSSITTTEVGDDFTIKGCTFSDWGTGQNEAVIGGLQFGLFTEGVTVTGGLIEGNTFSGNARTAIWLQTSGTGILDGLTIKDNDFLGCIETSDGHGIRLQGEIGQDTAGAAVIEDNTISDMSGTAIMLRVEEGSADTGEATADNNTISGCYQGIDMTAAWALTVTQNTITGCRSHGIKIGDGSQGTKTIKYNAVHGNNTDGGDYDFNNGDADESVTAEYNYWGSASGPSETTNNPSGQGGTINLGGGVDYSPWLFLTTTANDGDTLANIIANEVPAYANAVVLSSGWNTFSVPIGLDGQYNTWDELVTLTSANYSLAYRFNPTTQEFESLATTDTDAVAPGEGFYVKMNEAGSIPYCYSTVVTIPSRALGDGWNMIGGGMTPRSEIDSCASIITAGGTAGYTHMVNPASNTDGSQVYISGVSTFTLYAGEGFWVFLPIDRTLGLFDLTPVTWVP